MKYADKTRSQKDRANVMKRKRRQRTGYKDNKKAYLVLKSELRAHYGRVCVACGESDDRVLVTDHINHDRPSGVKNIKILRRLKVLGFPKGFRTLCQNCNWRAHLQWLEDKTTDVKLLIFTKIMAAIAKERVFQDHKFGPITSSGGHEKGAWLLLVESELHETKHALIKGGQGRDAFTSELIQVAAVCVAALEQHGLEE